MCAKSLTPLLLLLTACPTTGHSPSATDVAMLFLRDVGDAIVRVDVTRLLELHEPAALKLLDTDEDGQVSLEEVEVVVAASKDPTGMAWLYLVVRYLIEERAG